MISAWFSISSLQLSRENRYKEKTGKIKEMMEAPEAPKTDEETEIMNCE